MFRETVYFSTAMQIYCLVPALKECVCNGMIWKSLLSSQTIRIAIFLEGQGDLGTTYDIYCLSSHIFVGIQIEWLQLKTSFEETWDNLQVFSQFISLFPHFRITVERNRLPPDHNSVYIYFAFDTLTKVFSRFMMRLNNLHSFVHLNK